LASRHSDSPDHPDPFAAIGASGYHRRPAAGFDRPPACLEEDDMTDNDPAGKKPAARDSGYGGFNKIFGEIANRTSQAAGRALTFVVAVAVVVVWALTGPLFGYSDTWQLVINTGTTIITFLMVFLIQNTQNRDSEAIQIKLDELIRATKGAHTALLDLEELEDEDLLRIRELYQEIADKSRRAMEAGEDDTGTPFVHIENVSGDHNEARLKRRDSRTASSSRQAKKSARH